MYKKLLKSLLFCIVTFQLVYAAESGSVKAAPIDLKQVPHGAFLKDNYGMIYRVAGGKADRYVHLREMPADISNALDEAEEAKISIRHAVDQTIRAEKAGINIKDLVDEATAPSMLGRLYARFSSVSTYRPSQYVAPEAFRGGWGAKIFDAVTYTAAAYVLYADKFGARTFLRNTGSRVVAVGKDAADTAKSAQVASAVLVGTGAVAGAGVALGLHKLCSGKTLLLHKDDEKMA